MAPEDVKLQPVAPPQAVWMGVQETWFVVDQTLSYIGGVVIGREAADQLGGPIRIAQMSGQVATLRLRRADAPRRGAFGFDRAAQPVSDPAARWRSPFVLCELKAMRGRPLSERAQEVGFRIGLAIVMMLMIFATFNDIVHLTTS